MVNRPSGNINIGNINHRPGGGNNFVNINNRPGWGLGDGGHGNWANHWNNHCINGHHNGWYHGCWSGNWGNYWYAPMIAGATAWGLNALLPSWGYDYGASYSNPYYVESAAPVYNYSQPIAVSTYDTPTADATADASADSASDPQATATAPAPESPRTTEAYQFFDQALAAFKGGDYPNALQLDRQAIQKSPKDAVMHEVAALCMFATGDYTGAASVLNNLLAVAPGMDWTTMSSLYSNMNAYTEQLRALEARCRQKPGDAAAQFVLAYHYLVAGYNDAAVSSLKRVVKAQPSDQVAKRMLDSLAPPPTEQTAEAPKPAPPADSSPADSSPAEAGPTTDLVGNWRAKRDGAVFELVIDENNQFTWKATPKGKPAVTLAGTLASAGDAILLESKDQGTMAAQVKSGGADQFHFIAAGSPTDDKGILFQRIKEND